VNQAEIDARLALTGGGQFKLIDPIGNTASTSRTG
jgi:hypothetical protein